MKRLRRWSLGLVLLIAGAGPAAAENVLRFTGLDSGAAIMDPHSSAWPRETRWPRSRSMRPLLDVDSNLAIVPQLAVAWKAARTRRTWEFELRRNVRFHDGTPFTAEDVVFSIERARAEDV